MPISLASQRRARKMMRALDQMSLTMLRTGGEQSLVELTAAIMAISDRASVTVAGMSADAQIQVEELRRMLCGEDKMMPDGKVRWEEDEA